MTVKCSVSVVCVIRFLKIGTVVRSPLNFRAVPKAGTLSKTRLCGFQVGFHHGASQVFVGIGSAPLLRRCTVHESDERAVIFVACLLVAELHHLPLQKLVKKCVFVEIFYPVAAGTCANSQQDDRLHRREIWRASSGDIAFAASERHMPSSSRMWQISARVSAPHKTQRSLGAATSSCHSLCAGRHVPSRRSLSSLRSFVLG